MMTPEAQMPRGSGEALADTKAADSTAIITISKAEDNLRAKFALCGHEMRVVCKADGQRHYEVSRWGQARTCSTLHDLQAFLTQIGGAA